MDEPRQLAKPREPLLLPPPAASDVAAKALPPNAAPVEAAPELGETSNPLVRINKKHKEPDRGLYATNAGNAAALYVTIILLCIVEMNYIAAAIFLVLIIAFAVWSFWNHAAPHRGKAFQWIGVIAHVIILGSLGTYATMKRYSIEHSPQPYQKLLQSLADFSAKQERQHADIVNLVRAAINNPETTAAKSMAILDAEEKRVAENRQELNQVQMIISESPVTKQSLRIDLQNRRALEQNRKEQEDIQKQREAVKAKELQRQEEIRLRNEEIKRKNDQEIARQEHDKAEQQIAAQCIEIFNYAIIRLHHDLSNPTMDGGRITFDFQDFTLPYNSSIITNTKMIKGTNFIHLGTNYGWNFNIVAHPEQPASGLYAFRSPSIPAKLSITAPARGGESYVSVEALVGMNMAFPRNLNSCRIILSVTNAIKIDREVSVSECKKEIDDALQYLIETQDDQYPLPTKSNSP